MIPSVRKLTPQYLFFVEISVFVSIHTISSDQYLTYVKPIIVYISCSPHNIANHDSAHGAQFIVYKNDF